MIMAPTNRTASPLSSAVDQNVGQNLSHGSLFLLLSLMLANLLLSHVAVAQEDEVIMKGHTRPNMFYHPLPHTYIAPSDIPQSFSWANVNGRYVHVGIANRKEE